MNKLILALEVYKERKNLVYYLRPHFTNPKGLLNIITESNTYISSSYIIDYFKPGFAKLYFNIDFYI